MESRKRRLVRFLVLNGILFGTEDPKEYASWCKQNYVTMTLDLNRNNASASWGWKPQQTFGCYKICERRVQCS